MSIAKDVCHASESNKDCMGPEHRYKTSAHMAHDASASLPHVLQEQCSLLGLPHLQTTACALLRGSCGCCCSWAIRFSATVFSLKSPLDLPPSQELAYLQAARPSCQGVQWWQAAQAASWQQIPSGQNVFTFLSLSLGKESFILWERYGRHKKR